MKLIKTLTLILLVVLSTPWYSKGQAQQQPGIDGHFPEMIPHSPNAASLGTYGQIPTSLFNGLPQISIPVGQLVLGGINVDLSLNYHAGGIHPDYHPGWVGLGWNLIAGGTITREVNGGVDETISPYVTPDSLYSYYSHYSVSAADDWNNGDSLYRYVNIRSGASAYPAPDEFIFNFGKYSGSFFYDHTGKWQVRSESPLYLKVEEELKTNFELQPQPGGSSIPLRRIFYKFTLTTPDGCRYIFGGTQESIEFTRASNSEGNSGYNIKVIPTSWHLTQIITASGRKIDFKYQHDQLLLTQRSSILLYSFTGSHDNIGSRNDPYQQSVAIINPSYLSEITAADQKVTFSRSNTNELSFDYNMNELQASIYNDLGPNGRFPTLGVFRWKKLDTISFYAGNNNLLKKVVLNYKDQSNSRLMLTSVQEIGMGLNRKSPYLFTYDTTALPAYNSQQLDHWGFYNGRNYFAGHSTYYSPDEIPAYAASRAPHDSLMKAGILTGITYPTGGNTRFEYEPHAYSKIVQKYPFRLEEAGGNLKAGGLRIKKITDTDIGGKITNSKTYQYITDYNAGGKASSGILSGVPNYLDRNYWDLQEYKLDYWYWYDYSIEPLSHTNGNHVTYSEVAEILADSSYTIYQYTNHNNPAYLDQEHAGMLYTAPGQWVMDPHTSMALERGKLLRKRHYSTPGTLLKDTRYEYDVTSDRFKEAIRNVYISQRQFGKLYDYRITSYFTYTYPSYLTAEKDTTYDMNGANPIGTQTTYTYDKGYRVLKQTQTQNSKDQYLATYYTYPADIPRSHPSLQATPTIYREMMTRNMTALPVEIRKTITINRAQFTTSALLQQYALYPNKNILPAQVWSLNTNQPLSDFAALTIQVRDTTIAGTTQKYELLAADKRYTTQLLYDRYDSNGNVLQLHKANDVNTSFIWDYTGRYPLAQITGSNYDSLLAFTNKQLFTTYQTDSVIRKEVDKIRQNTTLAPRLVNTYTYAYGWGMSSATDPAGKILYYEYDGLGQLQRVRDQDKNILKSYCYYYMGQRRDCSGLYYNEAKSKDFNRECGVGYLPDTVRYTVPFGKYQGLTELEADKKALADIDSNGQKYANTVGKCTKIYYARIRYANLNVVLIDGNRHDEGMFDHQYDMYVDFYDDPAGTIPATVSNLPIALIFDKSTMTTPASPNPYTVKANGSSFLVIKQVATKQEWLIFDSNGGSRIDKEFFYNHTLLPKEGYKVID
ncbi:DUF5977 domain-containing protein [Chitinophaga nivalis]|uniref:DUF5977 domain-containing protein n=1 Tax=Chitinophaga nivalis TaxID=2991709 RepID=A0ABT3IKN5_9BACT|nr:DUF5977 domain-containing protein [Chitinophaga nivalis]MCW3465782.1 DUF5977 domain-containing protein [Chitinophaga nivalis]MCW3484527.1 DUF5977 domain-containing protein [Chitinophaga nivalis]